MQFERLTSGDLPISIGALAEFLRVDVTDPELESIARTAAAEIEHHTDIALTVQTIEATTDTLPGLTIRLPVGPLASTPNLTLELLELDGTTTPITSGFWIEGGRYPVVHFTDTEPGGRVRITYDAGYDVTPTQLQHAVMDHAGKLYDMRACEGRGITPGLSHAAARITARFRRVAV